MIRPTCSPIGDQRIRDLGLPSIDGIRRTESFDQSKPLLGFEAYVAACGITITLLIAALLSSSWSLAQSPRVAKGKLTFEVASVRENASSRSASSDFPLDDGESYANVGGLFAATGYTLPFYMRFALQLTDYQEGVILAELPEWAKMTRFDIEARATGNPSKDEMREMLIHLLEDRFALVFHHEMREAPVFWLELANTGKTGSNLRPHSTAISCPLQATGAAESHDAHAAKKGGQTRWPAQCGVLVSKVTTSGLLRIGARNVTLEWIANELSGAAPLGRQLIDHTGLSGTYDFVIEFTPEYDHALPHANPKFNENGLSFAEALKEQLGLKLRTREEPEDTIVIDQVRRPSPN